MALYKHGQHLTHSLHEAFDVRISPGVAAVNAGIYRCVVCGDEIGIAKDHVLPPQNHHQHAQEFGPVVWQLLVCAQQRS